MTRIPDHQRLGDDIFCVDTAYQRPRMAACYLVVHRGQVAIIDTGTAHNVPGLLALLAHLGISVEQVRYVIPTHVHLDHAGGAGQLMAACPNATLVTHPRGVPHLVDPARLTAGATAVYGEDAFAREFGELVAIPEDRAVAAEDGREIDLAGRPLIFLHTPGHANHHGCVWDPRSRGCFTGDTFGIAYPDLTTNEGPWLFATTTPVAFDPGAWHRSLDHILGKAPETLYLTHFGPIRADARAEAQLRRSIDAHAALAMEFEDLPADRSQVLRARVKHLLLEDARSAGVTLPEDRIDALIAMDVMLNAQGLQVWLQRRAKRAGT
ncbi:MAG: MBL fold metallo-hydrolase [Pseudomonadota bacterium]